ncbi:hypothetical protein R3P38DRAFT_2804870 [Favolaschia claudopus]|uniref:Uncharacterized protein n=1 Tax=Favolaschia claudopus TaxID=2862362 RepID=A0AAV9ZNV1_9AGAR
MTLELALMEGGGLMTEVNEGVAEMTGGSLDANPLSSTSTCTGAEKNAPFSSTSRGVSEAETEELETVLRDGIDGVLELGPILVVLLDAIGDFPLLTGVSTTRGGVARDEGGGYAIPAATVLLALRVRRAGSAGGGLVVRGLRIALPLADGFLAGLELDAPVLMIAPSDGAVERHEVPLETLEAEQRMRAIELVGGFRNSRTVVDVERGVAASAENRSSSEVVEGEPASEDERGRVK